MTGLTYDYIVVGAGSGSCCKLGISGNSPGMGYME
jgi:hypothetical protein